MDWIDEFIAEVFSDTRSEWINVEPLLSLLDTSSFDGVDNDDLYYQICGIDTKDEYGQILRKLLDNQTDPILSGRNYNQGDIMRKLREHIYRK